MASVYAQMASFPLQSAEAGHNSRSAVAGTEGTMEYGHGDRDTEQREREVDGQYGNFPNAVSKTDTSATPQTSSREAWKNILAKYAVRDPLPLKPTEATDDLSPYANPTIASAIPALARQHAAKLASSSMANNTFASLGQPSPFVPSSSRRMTVAQGSLMGGVPLSTEASPQSTTPVITSLPITSSPSTNLVAAAHLATLGVGVGPGINPHMATSANGNNVNGSTSNPPIINTGNNGPMYVQPGDWVCSACGFVNWRRRRVCMRCYPFADQTEVSKQIAQGAVLAAQLAAGLDLSQDAITSLTQSRKASLTPTLVTSAPLDARATPNYNVAPLNMPTHLSESGSPNYARSQQEADFRPSRNPSPHLWQQFPQPMSTMGTSFATHVDDATMRRSADPEDGSGFRAEGQNICTNGTQGSFASFSGSPKITLQDQDASYNSSSMQPPTNQGQSLGHYSGIFGGSTPTEQPWMSRNIWSSPTLPENASAATSFSSPLDSSILSQASSDFKIVGGSDGINESTKRGLATAASSAFLSQPAVMEAHLYTGDRPTTVRSTSTSSIKGFVDEQDEIILPISKTLRAITPRSGSPTAAGQAGGLDRSDETSYQPAAIQPPPSRTSREASSSTDEKQKHKC